MIVVQQPCRIQTPDLMEPAHFVQILDDVDIELRAILVEFPKDPDFQLHALDVQAWSASRSSLRPPIKPCL